MSVTRFSQRRTIPTALWNACDHVLQFNFKIAHIAGSVNNSAVFLSRLELKVTEKIRLKIQEYIQTTPIVVTTSSSDVTNEEQFFFTPVDNKDDEWEDQFLEWKEQSRQNAKQWVANEESLSLKTSLTEFTKSTETLRRIPWTESRQMQKGGGGGGGGQDVYLVL